MKVCNAERKTLRVRVLLCFGMINAKWKNEVFGFRKRMGRETETETGIERLTNTHTRRERKKERVRDVGIICGKIYKHGLKMESERERKRNAQSFEKEVIRRTYSRKFLELTMK